MTTRRPKIVVGCDGSPESERALQWAVSYAKVTGGSIVAASAWEWPTFQDVPITYGDYDPRHACQSLLERLTKGIDLPADRVAFEVEKGGAAHVLLQLGKNADLLVVGSHGLGLFSRLVLGSVSARCATHGTCPVAVVRAPAAGAKQRGVLVGMDDSDDALRALRWAMEYADLFHQPLTVVHVAETPPPPIPAGYPVPFSYPRAAVHRSLRKWLMETVEKEEADRGRAVQAGTTARVLDGNPANVMVEQSHRTALTVVARRGSGGFRRLLLGSVTAALAHHGESTLVVVPSQ